MSGHEHHHHISTDKILLSVAGGLFFLTLLTTGVHYLHLPDPWSIIAAMVIAFTKAGLVTMFFMNLYWDKRFNLMVLVFSLLFLGIFVGLTLTDLLFVHMPVPSF